MRLLEIQYSTTVNLAEERVAKAEYSLKSNDSVSCFDRINTFTYRFHDPCALMPKDNWERPFRVFS